ncbi:MAG: hypothetical protein PHR56_08175, partial [Dehalococcoidales bacterium]|nr:hypothetical protein [Dehalococcoidales bacterium]
NVSMMADVRDRYGKPVMAIVSYSTPRGMERARDVTRKFQARGIPAFPSIKRGAFALKQALDYHRLKNA